MGHLFTFFSLFLKTIRYHGCSVCGQPADSKRQKFDNTKRDYFRSAGYLIEKKECEWEKEKRFLKSPRAYFDIFNREATEDKILNEIKLGNLFGFVRVSVRSPDAFIAKYSWLNFPPVIHNFDLDESHLSPYMAERVKKYNKKFPVRTLGQTFHARSIWLFTPLAKFYMELGLELYDVECFFAI